MCHFQHRVVAGAPVCHQQARLLKLLNHQERIGVALPSGEAFAAARSGIFVVHPHQPGKDALQCFLATEMDALVLENIVVVKSDLKEQTVSEHTREEYLAQFKLD